MDMKESAVSVLKNCMDAKAGESVLIVTDNIKLKIGMALYEAAVEIGCEAMLMLMEEREVSGAEPPKAVSEAMRNSDIVICPTAKSLTHTNARINAVKNNARVGTMPGITEDMFLKGAITADFVRVEEITKKLADMLSEAKTARIEKNGLVLTLGLEGRNGVPSPGVYKTPGTGGNLPSGEAYIAPIETMAEGETIIDGSMVGIGKLEEPLYVKMKGGKLTKIEGKHSEKLDILFRNENNGTIAELGIGTNEKAILCGVILEDEKVYGTVHIAFGTNTSFGGVNKADCHMDGIILKPDLYLDDKAVIVAGEFVI